MRIKSYIFIIFIVSTLIGMIFLLFLGKRYGELDAAHDEYNKNNLELTSVHYLKDDVNQIVTTCDLIFNSDDKYNTYLVAPALKLVNRITNRVKYIPEDILRQSEHTKSFTGTITNIKSMLYRIRDEKASDNEYETYEELSLQLVEKYSLIREEASAEVKRSEMVLSDSKENFKNYVVVFTLLYFFLIISMIAFVSRVIAQPIKKLSHTVTQVVTENLQVDISYSGPQEIQVLGEHFVHLINAEYKKRLELLREQEKVTHLLHNASQEKKKLERTLVELEQVSHSRDQFLSVMSHELRTPLNLILGYSEALLDEVYGALTHEQKDIVEMSYQGGQRLLTLIANTLEYSRLISGGINLTPKTLNIFSHIDVIRDRLQTTYQTKQVNLHVQMDHECKDVWANEWAVKTIIFNLLDNAFKFSEPTGDVSLKVYKDEETLTISVVDRGLGIPEEMIDRVAEPFFQVNHGLNRAYDGAGLGLSIVSEIIKMHQGMFHITSTPHTETNFTAEIALPSLAIGSSLTPSSA